MSHLHWKSVTTMGIVSQQIEMSENLVSEGNNKTEISRSIAGQIRTVIFIAFHHIILILVAIVIFGLHCVRYQKQQFKI